MPAPYINIHTHQSVTSNTPELSLPNVIISKNYLFSHPCSLGIHPWYIEKNSTAQLDALYKYGKKEQVLAIGECGLDKLCDTPWSVQETMFRKQITYANSIRKPLIIHCVRAYNECLAILKQENVCVPVIFHGFDKNIELASQIIRHGYFLSLGPSIQSHKKESLIKQIPLQHIFLETDDKPVHIIEIYAYFCRVRKIEEDLLKEQLYQNFMRIFSFPKGC